MHVTCNTGKNWLTEFNGSLLQAKLYFLGAVFTDESDDGKETVNVAIRVCQV